MGVAVVCCLGAVIYFLFNTMCTNSIMQYDREQPLHIPPASKLNVKGCPTCHFSNAQASGQAAKYIYEIMLQLPNQDRIVIFC